MPFFPFLGSFVLNSLSSYGIDVRHVINHPGSTFPASIVISNITNGSRTILHMNRCVSMWGAKRVLVWCTGVGNTVRYRWCKYRCEVWVWCVQVWGTGHLCTGEVCTRVRYEWVAYRYRSCVCRCEVQVECAQLWGMGEVCTCVRYRSGVYMCDVWVRCGRYSCGVYLCEVWMRCVQVWGTGKVGASVRYRCVVLCDIQIRCAKVWGMGVMYRKGIYMGKVCTSDVAYRYEVRWGKSEGCTSVRYRWGVYWCKVQIWAIVRYTVDEVQYVQLWGMYRCKVFESLHCG